MPVGMISLLAHGWGKGVIATGLVQRVLLLDLRRRRERGDWRWGEAWQIGELDGAVELALAVKKLLLREADRISPGRESEMGREGLEKHE